MNLIKKHWSKILLVLVGIVCFLAIRQCSENKQWAKEYKENYNQKKDSFQSLINDKNQQIAIQEEKIIQRGKETERLEDSIEQLSKIKRQVKVVTKTEIREKKVKIDSPVYIQDTIGNKYLKTPVSFSEKKKWYEIKGTITDTGLIDFSNISFMNEPSITIGYKDEGFIKNTWNSIKGDREVNVVFKDKNPYTRVQSMDNIKVKDNLKKPSRFGLGLFGGYGVIGSETGWVIGGGLNYSIVKF